MTPLFSRAGQARLGQIVQPGLLCVFDFDGTLSPIVTHPERVALLPASVLVPFGYAFQITDDGRLQIKNLGQAGDYRDINFPESGINEPKPSVDKSR